jgi:hypothetical protein
MYYFIACHLPAALVSRTFSKKEREQKFKKILIHYFNQIIE